MSLLHQMQKESLSLDNMKKYLLLIMLSSFVFPLTFSRIVSTFDPSSKYTKFREDVDGSNPLIEEYDTDASLSFAYEHSFINKEIFHFYTGGEFMLSRSSSENISLHSIYIKPALSMTDDVLLFIKLGYCFLNKEDKDYPVKNGLMASAGFEYALTDRLSLGFSHSAYDLFEETQKGYGDIEVEPFPGNDNPYSPDTKNDIKYNKIGFSIIYGFDINKKKAKL